MRKRGRELARCIRGGGAVVSTACGGNYNLGRAGRRSGGARWISRRWRAGCWAWRSWGFSSGAGGITRTRRPAPAVPPPPRITNAPGARTAAPVAAAPPARTEPPAEGRTAQTILEAQIALARRGISSGSIDGVAGSQTRAALAVFQKKSGLAPSGTLDEATKALLALKGPTLTDYTISAEDFGRLLPMAKTWLGKSEQPRLDYDNILELLAEKSFSSPMLVRSLNPQVDWNALQVGARVTLPNLEYPPVTAKAARVRISLQGCALEAFDGGGNLLAHFPCSIGRVAEKRRWGSCACKISH